jgi:hypothetical protein
MSKDLKGACKDSWGHTRDEKVSQKYGILRIKPRRIYIFFSINLYLCGTLDKGLGRTPIEFELNPSKVRGEVGRLLQAGKSNKRDRLYHPPQRGSL